MTITRRNFLRGAAGAAAVLAAPAGLMALEPVVAEVAISAKHDPLMLFCSMKDAYLRKVDIYSGTGQHRGSALLDKSGKLLHFDHPHDLGVGDVVFWQDRGLPWPEPAGCFKGLERR